MCITWKTLNSYMSKADNNYAHPAYTRYPHLKSGHSAADFIHSHKNIVYGPWQKTFAWLPKTTLAGNRVWFQSVYKRDRKLLADIPQLPVGALNKVQWSTLDEILQRKLEGET